MIRAENTGGEVPPLFRMVVPEAADRRDLLELDTETLADIDVFMDAQVILLEKAAAEIIRGLTLPAEKG